MKARRFIFIILCCMLTACANSSPVPSEIAEVKETINTKIAKPSQTHIFTAIPTRTIPPIPTFSPSPSSTQAIIPTSTETPTITPPGGYIQILFGLPYSTINNEGCGGTGVITMDHNPDVGTELSFWDAHPEIPKPEGFTFRSKDGRKALDYCTFIGFPITFEMEEGQVTQNRIEDGVLDILITNGPDAGLTITHGHINPDTDLNAAGIQFLKAGILVNQGDIVGYTGRTGIPPGSDPSTQTGILGNSGYLPEQEMMLIGPDDQPNILYDT